jgi:hypothetical protein
VGNVENSLLSAYNSFLELCKESYIIDFSNNCQIQLIFRKDQFYHLAGLHKLKDIPTLNPRRKQSISKDILSERITTESISSSAYFDSGIDNVNDRIRYMPKIKDLFSVNRNVVWDFDSRHGKFHSDIKSTIIFFDIGEYSIVITLCCAIDGNRNYYYPETFFARHDRQYINFQKKVKVTGIARKGDRE